MGSRPVDVFEKLRIAAKWSNSRITPLFIFLFAVFGAVKAVSLAFDGHFVEAVETVSVFLVACALILILYSLVRDFG
jgi:uncharacterized membrane protein (GlpM family)